MTSATWTGTLGEALALVIDHRGKTPKKLKGDWVDDGVPVLSAIHLKEGRLVNAGEARCISEDMYERWMPEPLAAGDVLLTSEAPLGEVAYLQGDKRFCLGQRLFALRGNEAILDSRYLYYWLRGPVAQAELARFATGTTVLGIRQASLVEVPIRLPSVAAQQRVAAVLGSFDDLIENNRRRIEILEELARLIYREWFVHFRFPGHEDVELVDSALGPIPAGWEVVAVGDAVETVGGGTPSKKNPAYWESPTITWYTPSDLTKASSMFAFESADCINELGLKKSSARLFPARTVMMTSRATIGVISIAATEAATNQGFISCVPNGRLSEFHLYCWLRENVELFLTLASGATFKELRKSTFRELPIVVPPEPVEDAFRAVVGPMCELVANLTRQNRVLAEARDLLLPRLISGELDVSDLDLDVDLPTPTRVESVA